MNVVLKMIALQKLGNKLGQWFDQHVSQRRQNPLMGSKCFQVGFSLLEMVIIIAILGVLSAVAVGNMSTTSEVRDASVVQAAQAVLQQVIAQGSTRRDTSPAVLLTSQRANIINAANMLAQSRQDMRFSDSSPNFRLTITSSGRTATFSVSATGDVTLQPLNASQWVDYTVTNGVITKR